MRTIAVAALLAALAFPSRAGLVDSEFQALIEQAKLVHPQGQSAAPAASTWELLPDEAMQAGVYHRRHAALFSPYAVDDQGRVLMNNVRVLQAIDIVQGHVPDGEGGGYFTGVHATPTESPIGYALSLFGRPLLKPTRKTSFCTGGSYAAFVEALNLIFGDAPPALTPEQADAMRMQEADGGRREDGVKFWGYWNADDMGSKFALVDYSGMGRIVSPDKARAGDFMNIRWKSGKTHSVVFLGWRKAKDGSGKVLWWSSNEFGEDGLGDRTAPVSDLKGVKFVRLTDPQALANLNAAASVGRSPDWETVGWPFAPSPRGGHGRSRRRR